jgi:hypothetical protein
MVVDGTAGFVPPVPVQYRGSMTAPSLLLTVVGRDSPGIAARLFRALEPLSVTVLDVEQVQVHGRLLLCVEIADVAAATGGTVRADPSILLTLAG